MCTDKYWLLLIKFILFEIFFHTFYQSAKLFCSFLFNDFRAYVPFCIKMVKFFLHFFIILKTLRIDYAILQ